LVNPETGLREKSIKEMELRDDERKEEAGRGRKFK
jgi:hypothetical protein